MSFIARLHPLFHLLFCILETLDLWQKKLSHARCFLDPTHEMFKWYCLLLIGPRRCYVPSRVEPIDLSEFYASTTAKRVPRNRQTIATLERNPRELFHSLSLPFSRSRKHFDKSIVIIIVYHANCSNLVGYRLMEQSLFSTIIKQLSHYQVDFIGTKACG